MRMDTAKRASKIPRNKLRQCHDGSISEMPFHMLTNIALDRCVPSIHARCHSVRHLKLLRMMILRTLVISGNQGSYLTKATSVDLFWRLISRVLCCKFQWNCTNVEKHTYVLKGISFWVFRQQ